MESVYDAVVKEFEVAHDITSATPTLSRMNYRHGDTLLRWYADFEIAGTLSYRIFEVLDVAGRRLGWIHAAPKTRGFSKYKIRRAVESLRNAPRGKQKLRHA